MEIIQADSISILDRGLLYGDGFFTTAQVKDGQILLWQLHKERLKNCQQRLHFPELNWSRLESTCKKTCHTMSHCVLKIMVTRGTGGRGYLPPNDAQPSVIIQTSEFPAHYKALQQRGLKLQFSVIKLGHQPLLAGLKTLNRLEQVLIKQDASKYDCDDVLVCDIDDHVIETSVGNLIAIKDGKAFTPKLDRCGIEGVYLQHLSTLNRIEKISFPKQMLTDFDALLVCNSLLECAFVHSIGDHKFNLTLAQRLKTQLESGML
ncbi:aminodeoxychorismate lyase [Pseudoalteromonas sp. JBTF-M23]|uniref:Aminodeoxychorismate lyase n=1 Tax=Pseudoalteromonas caenipelagi TaxID=2726988 RepID=A0A849VA00_9GAMM|nr:aminodeoxychorismate lyase [Pseudoalteromonas caenipelagi]NOU49453.1 aminodeoxychorismate lyase [Pseudoalteromonas caenipelagi]